MYFVSILIAAQKNCPVCAGVLQGEFVNLEGGAEGLEAGDVAAQPEDPQDPHYAEHLGESSQFSLELHLSLAIF